MKPENRPSAAEALQHPWIQQANEQITNIANDLAVSALSNLQNFNAQSKLK
jgi:hypothetical protein